MAGGLVGLLDDVAALAKLAAKASTKAAGVVIDDTAVTPAYVQGLAADRELPIIKRIAVGSIRNKVVFILPVAVLLSEVAPKVVEAVLVLGGLFLAYEGAHKVLHALTGHHETDHDDLPAAAKGPAAEQSTVAGAIRTDFILSAEIMVISLKEVLEEPLLARVLILLVVAALVTTVVYGLVGLIVKMDDVGLRLLDRPDERARRLGRRLVSTMPVLLRWLSRIGTAAMLWVGGHIVLVGADELGWHGPYGVVHDLEEVAHDAGPLSGILEWLLATGASAVVGLALGLVLALAAARLTDDDRAPAAH